MAHDFHRFSAVWRANLKNAIESAGTTQRIRQYSHVISGGNDENIGTFHFIDTGLYGNKFFRIARIAVRCELIEIIEKDDGRRILFSFLKGFGNAFHKLFDSFVFTEDVAFSSLIHLVEKRSRH